ncbi:MAG: MATE family efflux transporter [Christensenella sp.]
MYERRAKIINQQFSKYFLPTILMTMALSMSVVIDGIIVGNILGADALAAVSIVMPVTLIFNAIYALVGVGGATLYSVALGRQDRQSAAGIFTVSVVMMALISAILFVASLVCVDWLSAALTVNAPALTEPVREYMGTLFLGIPFLILTPGLVYFLRAEGKPKLSSAVLIVANVVNLCLDLIFILVFKMGIMGAALATATGYAVGFIMALCGVLRTKSLRMRKLEKGWGKTAGTICGTGLPSALSTLMNFLRLTVMSQIVMATMGADGAVAFSVCMSCLSLTAMFVGGAAQTMIPIFGTLYGEKDYAGMQFTVNRTLRTVIIAGVALLVIFELFPMQISMLFGVTAAAQLAIAEQAIRIYSISLPFMGLLFVAGCVYQVADKRKLSSLVPVLENFVIVIPLALLLAAFAGGVGIWLAFPLAEVITLGIIALIAAAIRRKTKKGKGVLLLEEQPAEMLDVSIDIDVVQAVGLSAQAIEFCIAHGIDGVKANKVGVAIEEMAMNTIQNTKGKKGGLIDVRVNITENVAVIAMRDNAPPLDPMLCVKGSVSGGIDLLVAIAQEVKYSRLLGMNCTRIEIAV